MSFLEVALLEEFPVLHLQTKEHHEKREEDRNAVHCVIGNLQIVV
jgi:hypothetical protein